jgi:hypothetical protein
MLGINTEQKPAMSVLNLSIGDIVDACFEAFDMLIEDDPSRLPPLPTAPLPPCAER